MYATTQPVTANVKAEKCLDWAISSQASARADEGSTTRAWSLPETVKPHECAAGKVCSKCKQVSLEFHRGQVWCKECVRAYDKAIYAKKRDEVLKAKAAYRSANKEQIAAGQKSWAEKNPQYRADYLKAYRKDYIERPGMRAKRNQERMERHADVKRATPKWACREAISVFYVYARQMTEMLGEPYHVDHIYPLRGRNVCGLHVENNLRVITGSENSTKHNKFPDEIVCSSVKALEVGIKSPAITGKLFPDETYCLTAFDKVDANGTYHEWMLDTIVAPTVNRQIEGDDATFSTVVSPTRVGNYQQITRKTFLISRTQEKVAKAGRRRESARQVTKQMRELKNEIEYAIVRNQASSAGGSATARSTASMESWIATNEVHATVNTNGTTIGFSGGVVAAPTDGTTGAMTIAALNSALQGAWSSGGQASQILTSATQKLVIDQFASIATRFVDVDRAAQASIINAANVYVSSFGRHTVRMHRHVRTTTVLCIDPDMWAISFIDRPFMEKLAKTGDGDKYQLLAEWGLVSRNEAASAKVANIA